MFLVDADRPRPKMLLHHNPSSNVIPDTTVKPEIMPAIRYYTLHHHSSINHIGRLRAIDHMDGLGLSIT